MSKYRPNFHITPKTGWMNDPNGFVYFKNEFHMFAQHNPYDTVWGPMHWDHFVSKDLLSFKEIGDAIKPDAPYDDEFGCFSGSCIEKDGVLYLMYTGCKNEKQVQCIATSVDGVNFVKSELNPVIDERNLPKEYMIKDVRDPKIIKHNDLYYIFLAARKNNESSSIICYTSKDLLHFDYLSEVINSKEFHPGMFECPDVVILDGRFVLITSAQFLKRDGYHFQNVHSTFYYLGDFNYETGTFKSDLKKHELDLGFDVYATQSITHNNKTYLCYWKSMWDRNNPSVKESYNGALSLIYELRLDGDVLKMDFVKELNNYLTNEIELTNIQVSDKKDLLEIDKDNASLIKLNISCVNDFILAIKDDFKIKVSKDKIITFIRDNMDEEIFNNDGSKSDTREIKIIENINNIDFEIFIDNSCLQIFINDHKYAFSSLYFKKDGKMLKIDANNSKLTINKLSYQVFEKGAMHEEN